MAPVRDSPAGSNLESLRPLILLNEPGTVPSQLFLRDSQNADKCGYLVKT